MRQSFLFQCSLPHFDIRELLRLRAEFVNRLWNVDVYMRARLVCVPDRGVGIMASNSSGDSPSPARLPVEVLGRYSSVVNAGEDGYVPIAGFASIGVVAPPPTPSDGVVAVPQVVVIEPQVPGANSASSKGRTLSLPPRGSRNKSRRNGGHRARVGVRAVPRSERVWLRCDCCGQRNHVRRLFCTNCIHPRRRG